MDKECLRMEARKRRDALSEEQRIGLSQVIMNRLWQWEPFLNAKVILSYASFRSEVYTDEINERLLAEGKTLYFPKVFSEVAHKMEFYPVTCMEELVCGYQGIREPKSGIPLFSDEKADYKNYVMLMPGLAFDEDGNRLGYGGGYYDYYLARYKKYIAHTCMLAFEIQRMKSVGNDRYDIRPDCILTDMRGRE